MLSGFTCRVYAGRAAVSVKVKGPIVPGDDLAAGGTHVIEDATPVLLRCQRDKVDISEATAIGVAVRFDPNLQRPSGEFRDDGGPTICRLILGSICQGAYQQAPNCRRIRSFADFQHVFAL